MSRQLLPLIPPGLLVREVLASSDGLTIVATCAERAAACPDCGARSGVVHSRYARRLQDLPWQGRPVSLRIQARRLRCGNPVCQRRTFAERLADSAAVAGRRTWRLADLQRHLGLARPHLTVGELHLGRVEAQLLCHGLTRLHAGGIDTGRGAVAAQLAARAHRYREG